MEETVESIYSRIQSKRKVIELVIIGIILISSLFIFDFIQKPQIFNSKAAEAEGQVINFYGKPIHMLKLFGQSKYGEASRNLITASKVDHPAGVVVDKSSSPNKVYVADLTNNRILGFNGSGTCSITTTQACTIDADCASGESCKVDGTKPADIVFGQPDFSSGACNRDNNVGVYTSPTADSLCLIDYPAVTNVSEFVLRSNFDVDSEGNVYIVDTFNNRVLKYNQPFSIDKTGGKGDTTADFVWGQNDFVSGKSNGGSSTPSNKTLYTGVHGDAARGVSVDTTGIWVADYANRRVLHFPKDSHEADIVFGRSDFTTSGPYITVPERRLYPYGLLDRTNAPIDVKVDPENQDVYVLNNGINRMSRILVFKPPFTNGMPASQVIIPKQEGTINGWAGIDGNGTYTFEASSIAFNPYKTGEYANGKLWVVEGSINRVSLLDSQGNIVKVIGAVDKNSKGGGFAYINCQDILDPNQFYMWDIGGSIGIDSAYSMYFADLHPVLHRVSRYTLPYNTQQIGSTACLPNPSGGLFKGLGSNSPSNNRFAPDIVGIAMFQNATVNQMIVADGKTLKVWNNFLQKSDGSDPDVVIPNIVGRKLLSSGIDHLNRLWMVNADGLLRVYQLPFVDSNQQYLANDMQLFWQDNSEEVNYQWSTGITLDNVNKKLYIADALHHRVLRVKIPDDLSNKLYVDMVIGQPDKQSVGCNYTGAVSADGLCGPYYTKLDKLGNLYVVENNYECQNNDRIVVFLKEDLAISSAGLFPKIAAKKVFVANSLTEKVTCYDNRDEPRSPVAIAFNSKNQMVLGNDGYFNGALENRQVRQLWLYKNPLLNQQPEYSIELPLGASGDLTFDKDDNLIVQDHTWNRVWILNLNVDPIWLSLTGYPAITPTPAPVSLSGKISAGRKVDSYTSNRTGSVMVGYDQVRIWFSADAGPGNIIQKVKVHNRCAANCADQKYATWTVAHTNYAGTGSQVLSPQFISWTPIASEAGNWEYAIEVIASPSNDQTKFISCTGKPGDTSSPKCGVEDLFTLTVNPSPAAPTGKISAGRKTNSYTSARTGSVTVGADQVRIWFSAESGPGNIIQKVKVHNRCAANCVDPAQSYWRVAHTNYAGTGLQTLSPHYITWTPTAPEAGIWEFAVEVVASPTIDTTKFTNCSGYPGETTFPKCGSEDFFTLTVNPSLTPTP